MLTCSLPSAGLDQNSVVVQSWAATQRHLAQAQFVHVVQSVCDEAKQQVEENKDGTHNPHQHVLYRTSSLQVTDPFIHSFIQCVMMLKETAVAYRGQENHSSWMHKQTGSKHREMLGQTSSCVECAASQGPKTCSAPPPLFYVVVLTDSAEHTY